MRGMRATRIVIIVFLWTLHLSGYYGELNLSTRSAIHWASEIGRKLTEISRNATGLDALKKAYTDNNVKVVSVNGKQIVQQMADDIVNMLEKKVKAVERLAKVAERTAKNSVYNKNINDSQFVYYNAKKINNTKPSGALAEGNRILDLQENAHFNNIPVNINVSTVHVPTNVFDKSSHILYGVNWTLALEETFRSNYKRDPTLTWQYFGSSTGFLRIYPGMRWQYNDVDLYDCRSKGWYIQAAASPKDVVILVDASGSMLGQTMDIAKSTVFKILETLSDNDFFNIITFQKEPKFVDSCFNGTLVQATEKNKLRLKKGLAKVTDVEENIGNVAYVDKALVAGFELLMKANESGEGAMCNKAIMLVTDGSPEMYADVFKKYNWPDKQIRVFTYLIGREVKATREVQWMACSNKGYYTHISTLADVQENVQKYVNVASRPLVMSRAKNTIWTSVYLDVAGLKMMTSVAQPVYDIREETFSEGNLLGVVGTDVPLEEIYKLTPKYKTGVNGYVFAITNNGYVLFHPEFRPMTANNKAKPHYNNVDLAEVEFSDSANKLRRLMVDATGPGNMTMDVKVGYDSRKASELGNDFYKRVIIRRIDYFYYPLKDTPFTLGVALPQTYGESQVENTIDLGSYQREWLDHTVRLADWNYCNLASDGGDILTALDKHLQEIKNGNDSLRQACREDLVGGFLYDAKVSKVLLKNWQISPQVEQVWYGSRSGLSRGELNGQSYESLFIESAPNTIEESYYKRAADAGKDKFTFSVPIGIGNQGDENSAVITGSSGVFFTTNKKTGMAGAVGLQLKYTHVLQTMMNTSSDCSMEPDNTCAFTCFSEKVDCYLLDNNGYVVVAEDFQQVGKFFGEVDGYVMTDLIEKKVFKSVQLFDFQAVCQFVDTATSAAAYLLNPITSFMKALLWGVQELALFLIHFSVYSLWSGSHQTMGTYKHSDHTGADNSLDCPGMVYDIVNENQLEGENVQDIAKFQELRDYLANATDEEKAEFRRTFCASEPRVVNEVSCVKKMRLYYAKKRISLKKCVGCSNRRGNNNCDGSSGCSVSCESVKAPCPRTYTINNVPNTNLYLLQLDVECTDGCGNMTVSNEPKESTQSRDPDDDGCEYYKATAYRRRPSNHCYNTDVRESNGTAKMCGRSRASAGTATGYSLILTMIMMIARL